MEGSTPDWAAEDYATLEEVFGSRTFGQPLPEVTAPAVPVTAATVAWPSGLSRNRVVASLAGVAAALSVVAAVVTMGTGPTGHPLLSTQATGPSHVPGLHVSPPTNPAPSGAGSSGARRQPPAGPASSSGAPRPQPGPLPQREPRSATEAASRAARHPPPS